ncbi:preprotein translocase subunit SecY [Patescibacteria group bacterium]|jgi:preprotein translocase subunit SecY|nr:preprotein translocase subunit SecY [Patescibacteria group bacterium]
MNKETWRQLYKNTTLRKRLLVVLVVMVAYSLLSQIPVPVADGAKLQTFLTKLFESNSVLGFVNLFSGGALSRFSVLLMGLGPYINASIIIQLLTQVIPKLGALSKEGEAGRNKINYYTRLLTLPLAIIQSFAMVVLVKNLSTQSVGIDLIGNPTVFQWVMMVSTITAGSMLLMWMGELITEKGIGNGISMIILFGIVASLPATMASQFALVQSDPTKIASIIFILAAAIASIVFIVYLNEGQRNIPVSYARRMTNTKSYGGVDTHLPLRVITAGVIPIIFALAFLSIPTFMGQLFTSANTAWVANFAQKLTTIFSPTSWVYAITYFVLVVAFTYFYTAIIFKPDEIAENLQKQGGFIPGVRPGEETSKYLKTIITRITFTGSLGLGIVALLPFVMETVFKTSQAITIGGTSLLIIVAVIIETVKQLKSMVLMATYEKY